MANLQATLLYWLCRTSLIFTSHKVVLVILIVTMILAEQQVLIFAEFVRVEILGMFLTQLVQPIVMELPMVQLL